MKVITQLIRHFWNRGALSSEQAEYLLDQGFASRRDLPGFEPVEHAAELQPAVAVLAPHAWEASLEQLERPRRKVGRGGPKGDVPEEEDLRLWLNKQFARRARALSTLTLLGGQFGECQSWQEAAIRVRHASPERFSRALARALRSQEFGLRSLWQAVDVEPFYARMEDAALRGPTVRAFRMLLSLQDPPHLGKYAWILKLAEVQAACNLIGAHRRVLRGLADLFRHHRASLNAALRYSTHPVPQWALILLHNAQRGARGNGAARSGEYGPIELPADDVWKQAWTCALVMDEPAVTRLLVRCYGRQEVGDGAECQRSLHCPLGWKVG